MAAVFRIGVIGAMGKSPKPLIKAALPALTQTCGIAGKVLRKSEGIVRPKPYPYKEKDYAFWQSLFDSTTSRFDDNSKVRKVLHQKTWI